MKEPDRAQDIQEAPAPHATSEPHTTPNAMPHAQDGPTATELSVRLKTSGKDNMNNVGNLPVGAASQAHVADHRAAQGKTTATTTPTAPDTVKDNSKPKAATKKSKFQRAPIKLRNGRRFLFRDPSSAVTSSSATRGSSTGAAPSAATASSPATTRSTAKPSSTATATPQAKEPRPLPEVSRAPSATVTVTVTATVMDKHFEQADKETLGRDFDINVAEAKACVQCLVLAVRKYGVDSTVETIEVFIGSKELLNSLTKFHTDPPESASLKEQLQQVYEFVVVLKKLGKRVMFTCVKDHGGGDMGGEGKSKADGEVAVRDGGMKGEKIVSLKRKKGEDEGQGDGSRKKTKSQP